MRAIVMTGRGGPEVLALRELPVPAPTAREVLVRVRAAGVNRADLLLQAQQAPVPEGWSATPGLEISGIVEAVGSRARRFSIGDRVMALSLGGGYAEFCAVNERLVLPWPDALPAEQAAGLPEALATVWTSLVDRGRPKSGEAVLIHGGASTIGSLAIAVATQIGCRVVATAGSADKRAAALAAGATAAIDYRAVTATEELMSASGGSGYDVILDLAGGTALARNIQLANTRARIVQIGMMEGTSATIDLMPLMAKRVSVLGSTLFFRTLAEKGAALHRGWLQVAPLLDRPEGLSLHVDRGFPLEQAAQAQQRMNAADHRGKVVIVP